MQRWQKCSCWNFKIVLVKYSVHVLTHLELLLYLTRERDVSRENLCRTFVWHTFTIQIIRNTTSSVGRKDVFIFASPYIWEHVVQENIYIIWALFKSAYQLGWTNKIRHPQNLWLPLVFPVCLAFAVYVKLITEIEITLTFFKHEYLQNF